MEISNKNRSEKSAVIVLIGLTLFLIVFIFYMLGSNQKLFSNTYTLYLFLDNAGSLKSGSFINLAGIKAGVVGELKFTEKENRQGVRIELKMDKKYRHLITASSRASVDTKGVLGSKYVEISLGKKDEPPLESDSYLTVKTKTSMGEAFEKVAAVTEDLSRTLQKIDTVTRHVLNGRGVLGMLIADKQAQQNLTALFANLKYISSRIARGEGNAGKLVRDTVMYAALRNTMQNLQQITGEINEGRGNLGMMVKDSALAGRLNHIALLADSLMIGLNDDGTVGNLVNDKQLYEQTVDLVQKLNGLISEIKAHPKKFFSFELF